MIDWRLRVLGLLAATLALAVPASASGAVTIGSNLAGAANFLFGCGNNTCTVTQRDLLVSATASGGLVAPSDGVVVRWRIKVGPNGTTPVALRIIRRPEPVSEASTGGGTGPTVTPPANQTSTYDVQLPIFAGNSVGIDCCATPAGGSNVFSSSSGATLVGWDPALVDNAPARSPNVSPAAFNDLQLLVNADIEPDCDNDGLGDETQDPNISSCAPPPPGTTPPPIGIPPPGSPPGTPPVTCRGLNATIVGTEGSDVRTASQGQDVIAGLGGNDTLSGLGGKDVICGGRGKDTLRGGKGKDTLLGQKGKDTLRGGGGKDVCKGGKGNDTASKCEVEKSI
jgi:hypothetical protein